MKFPLSFYKLVMAAAVALPTMAFATITPEAPTLDNTDNCYMIGSAAELYGFAEKVNGTDGGFSGCGKLTANIVVNENVLGTDNANVNASGAYTGDDSNFDKWAPINGFAGKFHGQGHTISGLYFNDPEKENVGLFGSVGDVEIDGLGLVDSYFEGRFFVGGFIGFAEDVNVYIRDSYNSSVMRGHSDGGYQGGVGGFVGALIVCNLEIGNSYNLGFVTGERDAGGFVGYILGDGSNNYVIFNSYNRGSVISADPDCVGGFVGNAFDEWAWLYVYNSYNAGKVNGGEGFALMSGGFGPEGVDNFYYLEGSANGWGVNYDEKESTPAADFADGTVAKLLHDYSGKAENGTAIDGSVWGQVPGRDAFPTLAGAIGPVLTLHVYGEVKVDSTYTPGTALPTPTREGFAFLGWFTDAGFSGSAVTNIPSDATGALEYFAKWIGQDVYGCYEIASAAELYSFAAIVNGGAGEICGKLTDDITVNEGLLGYVEGGVFNLEGYMAKYGKEPKAWTPMNVWNPEMPVFLDGNGKKISGLYIDGGSSMENVGLFSFVAAKVAISNLGIVDSYIVSKQNAGAFAGYVTGSLDITNCYNASTIVVTYTAAGGLVGCSGTGTVNISQSYNAGSVINTGTVTTAGEWPGYIAGGFVGSTESGTLNIVNSYNLGSVTAVQWNVGGFVGYAGDELSLTIANSYNMGTLKNSEWTTTNIVGYFATTSTMFAANNFFVGIGNDGGAMGMSAEKFMDGSVATYLHNYKTADVDGSVWGQAEDDDYPVFSKEVKKDVKTSDLVLHLYAGYVLAPSFYVEGTEYDLPANLVREDYVFLGWYETSDFSGSVVTEIPANATGKLEYYAKWIKFVDNCYEIASAAELYSFAAIVNGGDGKICGKLTDDITVNKNVLTSDGLLNGDGSNFTSWTPIGTSSASFKGTFYGQGHTISGLYYAGGWQASYANAGLFGYVEGEVVIDGVGIVDSYFYANNSVGALVGKVGGSSTDGSSLTISNSYNAGRVSGLTGSIGGLVGGVLSSVVINNSYNAGFVNGANKSQSTGGLVGSLSESATASINNSYNAGSVTGKSENTSDDLVCGTGEVTVTNSFFTGKSQFEGNGATKKTASEFANGIVALLLRNYVQTDCKENCVDGSVWGQNVGQASDNDAAPTLSGVLKLGLLAIAKDAAGKETVAIDGNSALEVKIPADIHVDYVKFNRTFTSGVVATIVLPFDVPSSALPGNAEFGALGSVGPNSKNGGKWEAVFNKVTELEAHTPYLVRLSSGTSLDFDFGEAGVTIKATEEYDEVSGKMVTVPTSSTSTDEQWELVGTYSYKSWQEGDPGIGSTYGFAGSAEGENVVAGQFIKVGAGAYINPMRTYLQKVTKVNPGRRALGNASVLASIPEELPEYIDVVFVDSDDAADANEVAAGSDSAAEKTTYIGRINTRTGAIEFKRTYDAKGRMLNSKPTAKGNYFNKKVIK